jgi:ribonuclease HI
LQNLALRKILGVFKTSPYKIMELEAALPPPEVRFNKICRSYILRTLQFEKSHIIKDRLPKDFILNPGEKEKPNLKYYYNWNDPRTPRNIRTRDINNPDSDPEYRPPNKKYRKYKSQIDFLTLLFSFTDWSQFIKSDYKYKNKDINKLISIIIPEENKEIATKNHINMIQEWNRKNIMDSMIIFYSDGSKLKDDNGVGIYNLNSNESHPYNIGKEQEIYDSEFFGIYKALELANERINPFILDVWIFSDSQSILKGLKTNLTTRNHFIYSKIYEIAKEIKDHNININIQWSPGHMNIFGNEKADKIAKYAAENLEPNNIGISISFIKRRLKEKALLEWELDWYKAKEKKGKESLYKRYNNITFKWKANPLKVTKLLWSSIQQLKMGHGYFLSYLKRFNQQYEDDICNKCQLQQKQTPYHLILGCPKYNDIRKITIGELEPSKRNLYFLYSKPGIPVVIEYLKKSKIVTRKWILLEEE